MTAFGFVGEIEGAAELERAFENVGALISAPAPLLEQTVEDWFAETEREQFDSEGAASASGRWKPLARSTLQAKAIEREGVKILQRTGVMRNQLTQPGSLRQFVETTGDEIVFHLPPPAGYHQSGTARMPQRKVVDPSDAQLQRLVTAVRRDLLTPLRRTGLEVTEGSEDVG